MSCGMCFECGNCVIYCPQDAVKRTAAADATMGRYVYTDYDRCIGCHICAEVCPTGYINMGMGTDQGAWPKTVQQAPLFASRCRHTGISVCSGVYR